MQGPASWPIIWHRSQAAGQDPLGQQAHTLRSVCAILLPTFALSLLPHHTGLENMPLALKSEGEVRNAQKSAALAWCVWGSRVRETHARSQWYGNRSWSAQSRHPAACPSYPAMRTAVQAHS